MSLFECKTIIVRNDRKTRYIRLTPLKQITLLILFLCIVGLCCLQYARYVYTDTDRILSEYERVLDENKKYKEYFSSVSRKLDKINEYMSVRQRIDGLEVPSNGANYAITKAILDKQMDDTYKGMEDRNKYLNKKIEKLNINTMDYQNPLITNNANEERKAQGGPYERFSPRMLKKTKPLFKLYKVKINDDNYKESIEQLINAEHIVSSLPLGKPMSGTYRITSKYGKRVDPINNSKIAFHKGLDIVINNGYVLTPKSGVVSFVGKKQGYGNCLEIEHSYFPKSYSIKTRYAHLSKINVVEGERVITGQKIGIQGSSGRSTGEHLHYSVLINDNDVNPINFLLN